MLERHKMERRTIVLSAVEAQYIDEVTVAYFKTRIPEAEHLPGPMPLDISVLTMVLVKLRESFNMPNRPLPDGVQPAIDTVCDKIGELCTAPEPITDIN